MSSSRPCLSVIGTIWTSLLFSAVSAVWFRVVATDNILQRGDRLPGGGGYCIFRIGGRIDSSAAQVVTSKRQIIHLAAKMGGICQTVGRLPGVKSRITI